ncbi:helix-turn-helix domain-containing protein [Rhizobium oryzicola]|uniref:AraC family transcriptional regulator n=1 Tax=Rhizobium oryzicola TaxID=1232668 RepID=A0ABT8SXA2_9HYPH|nr:AraC family transcriptional regulator [Rhizobium oryzicola]MDO1583047.1 AraC family transcriptional regulator [Rhizobium oryzicola]
MARTTSTNRTMDYLRVKNAQTVTSSVLNKGIVTATRLTRESLNHGFVDQHVTEDAFMIALQLRDYHGDLWVDGRKVDFPASRQGHFTLYDYNRLWQADMKSAFDVVNFHVPRAALVAFEEDLGGRRIETLNVTPGADVDDATVRGIAHALLPALADPQQTNRLFLDHMTMALSTHLAVTYGEASRPRQVHSGGLAGWQLKRAIEIMEARLDGDIPIAAVAQACGLSSAYFTRAFKLSTGLPPHRWLQRMRIDRARDMMRDTGQPLPEIATHCGFVDQSHFTRVFSSIVGMTPGAWRNIARG